jgi:hypothetical protein
MQNFLGMKDPALMISALEVVDFNIPWRRLCLRYDKRHYSISIVAMAEYDFLRDLKHDVCTLA